MKKSILIIDDNPENCEDYIAPLREHYNVIVSMTIRDALRRIKFYDFDLIVIDIMMPTNGIDNTDDLKTGLFLYDEKLKSLEINSKLQYLFWSNLSQDTYNEHFAAFKPNNVEFAHKETKNKKHLLEKVNQLIG